MDATLMTRPPSARRSSAAFVTKATPLRSVSTTVSHAVSSRDERSCGTLVPALFTRMSRLPHSRPSRSKHTRIDAAFRTSSRSASDRRYPAILSDGALEFLSRLHREVEPVRQELLLARAERWEQLRSGGTLDFLDDTRDVRELDWRVADVPHDLRVRKVEITGPTDRKMVINALNSGASVYMADFEDANTPTWQNMVEGQQNLIDAIERKISFTNPDGRVYRLNDQTATLVVRPRGWHLNERHLTIDGLPIAGALFDFGLYAFHNAVRLLKKGTAPYFYLPKLESHREARLWNEIFDWTEKELNLGHGRIKATVLVEVLPLAFE